MIKETKFENGLTLLTEDIPYVRSVSIGIFVKVGSRDEEIELNGLSHFIEHLMFKGTKKRSAKQIAEALDNVGGILNAFTSKEYTCYYSKVLDEHFSLALDVLTDMLFSSRFEENDIDRERNVILEEIKMYEDSPDELVHDVFAGTVLKEHSLGKSIGGRQEVIKNVNKEKILEYYRKYYVPSNMVISVAGNINHEEIRKKVEDAFPVEKSLLPSKALLIPDSKPNVVCKVKDIEQVNLCLGGLGLSLNNPKMRALQMLDNILGGGTSSRLFQKIREQRGLVYSVYTYHNCYYDTGLFCVSMGLSAHNLEAALDLVGEELKAILNNGVTGQELRRAKEQAKGNFLLSLESVNTRMSRMGKYKIYFDRIISTEEVLEQIEKVSLEDMLNLSQEILKPNKFSLVTVGPLDDFKLLKGFWEK